MPIGKPQKLPRSANSAASFRPAPPGKKSFASSRSACAVCFQEHPDPSPCLAAPEIALSPPPNGGSAPPTGSLSPNNAGLFAEDAPIFILVDPLTRAALTCLGKVLRSAFLLSPAAKPLEYC